MWYRANYKFEQRPDPSFDLDAWTADHDRLVWERAKVLREAGCTVGVESDNAFTLKGKVAVLGGKPDLVAYDGRSTIYVDDVKTGRERDSDLWQVRTYLFALPKVTLDVGRKWIGRVVYRGDRIVEVAAPSPPDVAKISSIMQMAGGELEPPRVPSREECGRCNILNCPDRDDTEPATGEAKEF